MAPEPQILPEVESDFIVDNFIPLTPTGVAVNIHYSPLSDFFCSSPVKTDFYVTYHLGCYQLWLGDQFIGGKVVYPVHCNLLLSTTSEIDSDTVLKYSKYVDNFSFIVKLFKFGIPVYFRSCTDKNKPFIIYKSYRYLEHWSGNYFDLIYEGANCFTDDYYATVPSEVRLLFDTSTGNLSYSIITT